MANTKEDNKVAQNLQNEGTATAAPKKTGTSNRGFASMDPARQREIASEGGKAAHASGNAHEFSSEEAREAGRKGGESRGKNANRRNLENDHRPGSRPGS